MNGVQSSCCNKVLNRNIFDTNNICINTSWQFFARIIHIFHGARALKSFVIWSPSHRENSEGTGHENTICLKGEEGHQNTPDDHDYDNWNIDILYFQTLFIKIHSNQIYAIKILYLTWPLYHKTASHKYYLWGPIKPCESLVYAAMWGWEPRQSQHKLSQILAKKTNIPILWKYFGNTQTFNLVWIEL